MSPRVLLCDADGNLFPSEEPAFEASCAVTNRLLADLGVEQRFTPDELRRVAMGKNFRATASDLAAAGGVELDAAELERRVEDERREVIAHLREVLRPDDDVLEPLRALSTRHVLAAVSSSALARLDACFSVTGLAELLPPAMRFSAEDSLPAPTSKPDPAIYVHAGQKLAVGADEALAVEDSVTGVLSAVRAGFPVVGNLLFVPAGERRERRAALLAAGARDVVDSWWELAGRLGSGDGSPRSRDLAATGG